MKRRSQLYATTLALAAHLLGACASDPASPETQVRAVLARAEDAVEARDLQTLKELISDAYLDDRGQKKQTVAGFMQFYFMQHRSIHLFTQIKALTFPEPSRATVGLLVGMAGQPFEGVPDPKLFRVDLYRFDFTLVEEGAGDWKVTRAAWRRAKADEQW